MKLLKIGEKKKIWSICRKRTPRRAFSTGGYFWGVLSSGGTSRAHRMRNWIRLLKIFKKLAKQFNLYKFYLPPFPVVPLISWHKLRWLLYCLSVYICMCCNNCIYTFVMCWLSRIWKIKLIYCSSKLRGCAHYENNGIGVHFLQVDISWVCYLQVLWKHY